MTVWAIYRWYGKLYQRRMSVQSLAAIDKDIIVTSATKRESDRLLKLIQPIEERYKAEVSAADVAYRMRCQTAAIDRDAAIAEVLNAKP